MMTSKNFKPFQDPVAQYGINDGWYLENLQGKSTIQTRFKLEQVNASYGKTIP